jgi:hypothetical protein
VRGWGQGRASGKEKQGVGCGVSQKGAGLFPGAVVVEQTRGVCWETCRPGRAGVVGAMCARGARLTWQEGRRAGSDAR